MTSPKVTKNADLREELSPKPNSDPNQFPPQSAKSNILDKIRPILSKIDPLKCALIISIISLLITIITASVISSNLNKRIEELETNPDAYGIVNINETYTPGGYFGWTYQDSYPELYPLQDIHAHIGDRIFFSAKTGTQEDLWLVPKEVYETCNFTNKTNQIQLAIARWIRADTYLNNVSCIVGTDGCSDYGWKWVETMYNTDGGYTFLIQDYHVSEWGNPLYFASAREWDNWNDLSNHGCLNGIKLAVHIDERKAVPLIEDDGTLAAAFDQTALDTVNGLMDSIGHLSRMLILQQFNFEQRIRSQGDSGLTNVRGSYDGDAAYDDGTYSNGAIASIHNHADNILIVGIGEIQAVLNGVEFQTRHNDYNLNMPHRTSNRYHSTEPVPRPDVPPEVLNKQTVNEQIKEMQEWFRAFKNQDHSVRDYRQYFKPVLCVLEGTYLLNTDTLEDAFDSDRHQLDASTWESLHNKVRWMANSGRKNSAENLAHLPGVLRYLQNDTWPVVSNWEYRIICAPLKNDVPTSRFKIEDDLHIQIQSSPKTRDELYYDRRARFKLNTFINLDDLDDHRWSSSPTEWNYLDYLMEQVPGKDNFGCQISDTLPDGSQPTIQYNSFTNTTLNSCYYSRYYRILNDNKGSSSHRRSYSDQYMFAAQTTQAKVSPIKFDFEIKHDNGTSSYYPTESKWSYAIPLEIIYLTPLHQWNPYNIIYDESSNPQDGGRNGICSQGSSRALLGSNRLNYFRTPVEFYASTESQSAADTSGGATCVLDSTNTVREVRASGHWITFPEIAGGVGQVRQRYPIFPIHEAGSVAWKEVKALQQIVLKEGYDDITSQDLSDFFGPLKDINYGFSLLLTGGGSHQHEMYIPGSKIAATWYNATSKDYIYFDSFDNNVIKEDTEWRNGHTHTLDVSRKWNATNNAFVYKIIQCRFGDLSDQDIGYTSNVCSDGHNAVSRY